ncbi:MAG: RNA 2'-phosphotransferase [Alphaproteobacteria bacterium]|nr:RNA 2'-phosphotransferase [Alphaproteobacteria bacterium]
MLASIFEKPKNQLGTWLVNRTDVKRSKLLSLVLRHRPEVLGITLDRAGWTGVPALLDALARVGEPMSMHDLERLVAESDKQRFAFNADYSLIRANQGHSVPVELGLAPTKPPETLYHGTARHVVVGILREGLSKRKRHHVHLHADRNTATAVGQRHGEVVILTVEARAMHRDSYEFYVTANDVWLTETVPPSYIRRI